MNGWTKAIQFGVLIAVAAVIFFFLATRDKASSAPSPQAGAQDVYLDKCSVCHAKDGSGNTAKGRKLKVKDVRSPDVQKMSEARDDRHRCQRQRPGHGRLREGIG